MWRKENKLEQLYETIDVKDYEECRRLVSYDKSLICLDVALILKVSPMDWTS